MDVKLLELEKQNLKLTEIVIDSQISSQITEFLAEKPRPSVQRRLSLYFQLFPQFFTGWTPQTNIEKGLFVPKKIQISNNLYIVLGKITGKKPKNIKRGISEYFKKNGMNQVANYDRTVSTFLRDDRKTN
ncbi:hypothetical protein M0811_05543 [Anaeramoeba ignava]|uniref:Uncharacterized protein n=1 Tax=Anaeramoeba ignava TaxID=1746090 RepID=A0A9Q0LRV2_ANAIG|nr:hypothetical protein M0811_05543 [Anaeramoeba ignava]